MIRDSCLSGGSGKQETHVSGSILPSVEVVQVCRAYFFPSLEVVQGCKAYFLPSVEVVQGCKAYFWLPMEVVQGCKAYFLPSDRQETHVSCYFFRETEFVAAEHPPP